MPRERIEPIAQGPARLFHMHRPSWLQACSKLNTNFDGEQPSMLIAMLDGLLQRRGCRDHPCRTSPFACQGALAIRPHENAPIAVPSITEPTQGALVGSLHGSGHRLLDEILVQRAGGAGNHEATVPILHEASPAFSLIRLASCPLFFCTNDQNSSIST